MGSELRVRARFLATAIGVAAAMPRLAHAQAFTADYDIGRPSATDTQPLVRLAPALSLGGDSSGGGLSVQAGRHWFGQVAFAPGPVNPTVSSNDILNLAGGYRWGNGQTLSLQLSRGHSSSQRLGLAVNYDWPHYFMRFSYAQGLSLAPQESLRFSAGVRF